MLGEGGAREREREREQKKIYTYPYFLYYQAQFLAALRTIGAPTGRRTSGAGFREWMAAVAWEVRLLSPVACEIRCQKQWNWCQRQTPIAAAFFINSVGWMAAVAWEVITSFIIDSIIIIITIVIVIVIVIIIIVIVISGLRRRGSFKAIVSLSLCKTIIQLPPSSPKPPPPPPPSSLSWGAPFTRPHAAHMRHTCDV